CDHRWDELRWNVDVEFVGIIREGEWLLPKRQPVLQEADTVIVGAKLEHVGAISRVLAAGGKTTELQSSELFGDFTLLGDLLLKDVAGFYPVGSLDSKLLAMSLHDYFTQKFHRRVVVGDQLQLGLVLLTVRDVNDDGFIRQVGVKLLEEKAN